MVTLTSVDEATRISDRWESMFSIRGQDSGPGVSERPRTYNVYNTEVPMKLGNMKGVQLQPAEQTSSAETKPISSF